MNKKWLLLLTVGILILTLAACTGSTPPNPTSSPIEATPGPTDVIDMDADESHDDADMDTDADDADDDDADEALAIDAAAIFSDRCSTCHGDEREGGGGPPLLPANLTKDPSAYVATITNGSGIMPTWGNRLSEDEINALVDYILSDAE